MSYTSDLYSFLLCTFNLQEGHPQKVLRDKITVFKVMLQGMRYQYGPLKVPIEYPLRYG